MATEKNVMLTTVLYKIHDYLTDKKIFGEEEKELKDVRSIIDSGEQCLIDFYQNKIIFYQHLLIEIEKIEKLR